MVHAANIKPSARRASAINQWRRLARASLNKYYADQLSVRAASLSYWTLLSLVPFLAVTFSVLKAFGGQDLIQPFLIEILEPVGPGRVEMAKRIGEFVDNTRVGVLGAVGVAGLFYTVVALIGNVEEALNQIWRAQPVRNWTRRYGEFLGLLLIGPVLLFATLAMIAAAQSYWLVERVIELPGFEFALALLTQILPFFLLWCGFALLYKMVPSAEVHWRSALFGGAVAAILWHLAGMAFAAFVADSVNYRAIYSGFAIVVVFFIWLNVAWLIVLVGGMMAYLHQHARLYVHGETVETLDQALQEWLAATALVEIARHYVSGKGPVTETALSDRLGVSLAQVDAIVDRFVRHGVLLRSADPPGVSLARTPEKIAAVEILRVARGELAAPSSNGDAVSELLRRRDQALQRGLQGITLRSLIEEDAGPAAARDGEAQAPYS
ncbi:MAG TPA: YhjD/YihY/BrkB family envelope integrity protein [Candidatus Binatia bacterium]